MLQRFEPSIQCDTDNSVFDRLTDISYNTAMSSNGMPFQEIFDDSKNPLVSLENAVTSFPFDCKRYMFKLKQHLMETETKEKIHSVPGMSEDFAGSIWLYTIESPLYKEMNAKLREGDVSSVRRHYFPFMRIFLSAIRCLRDQNPKFRNVNRGVRCDVVSADPDAYQIGKTILFSSFTSATATVSVLKSPLFFGESGARTMFQLHTSRSVDISPFAAHREAEVLLPCGLTFAVVGVLPAGNGLTVMQLEDTGDAETL